MLFRFSDTYKSYAGTDILKGVTFQVNPGEKVGLVGRNGAGKTTLFKLLMGKEAADEGEVLKASGLKIGLLDQHVHFDSGMTVHDFAISAFQKLNDIEKEMRQLEHEMSTQTDDLEDIFERYGELQHQFEHEGGFEVTAKAESVLLGLNFPQELWTQDTGELSGGQQNRLGLVRLLLSDADVLLLDEPTNHLDINSVEWLEEFLRGYEKAYMVISHDRYFLDRTCTRTLELDEGMAYGSPGNYSEYLAIREERRESQRRAYENQQSMIAKSEDFIRRNLAGQKTKLAKSRRNTLERLERVDAVREDRSGGNFGLKSVERAGGNVLMVEELSVGYDETVLLKDLNMTIYRGDSLGIIGENGSGKTTLIKTLVGKLRGISGEYRWGSKTDVGYYSQQLEELDPRNEIIWELRRVAASTATDGEMRGYLAKFLFVGDDVYKLVGDLSGGEKGRLALAKLIYSRHNVLVLDEPTNHLDIPSREALENALVEYDGTLIAISHDRFFLDKIADRILALFKGRRYDLFDGDYSEYHDWKLKEIKSGRAESADMVQLITEKEPLKNPAEMSKNERIKLEKTISSAETEIAGLEGQLSRLTQQMSEPDVAISSQKVTSISDEYSKTEKRIAELYKQWEEASKLLGT